MAAACPAATAGMADFTPIFMRPVRLDFLSAKSPASDYYTQLTFLNSEAYIVGTEEGKRPCQWCLTMHRPKAGSRFPFCCNGEHYARFGTVRPAARAFGMDGILPLCKGGCGEILPEWPQKQWCTTSNSGKIDCNGKEWIRMKAGWFIYEYPELAQIYPEHWGLGEGGAAEAAGVLLKPDIYDIQPHYFGELPKLGSDAAASILAAWNARPGPITASLDHCEWRKKVRNEVQR